MQLFGKVMIMFSVLCLLISLASASVQEELSKEEQMRQVGDALSSVKPGATEFDFVTFDLARTTVILRGFTIGEQRKVDCAAAVKELDWVGHVLNYVEALPNSYSDEKIRENIRFILRKRVPRIFGEDKAKIRVKVKEGDVTLIGAIEEGEVEALERAVGEIRVEDMVRSVENKTVVRKQEGDS